jgi:hypothetical protein
MPSYKEHIEMKNNSLSNMGGAVAEKKERRRMAEGKRRLMPIGESSDQAQKPK